MVDWEILPIFAEDLNFKIMNIVIVVLSAAFLIELMVELINIGVFKSPIFKKLDITVAKPNPLNNDILSVHNDGVDYISKVPFSILFPYYISLNKYTDKRTILIFSKNYFLIKKLYK